MLTRREGPSKKISVPCNDFMSDRKRLRALDLGGGKPAKVKRSVGRPDEASAVSGADAPGMA
jgi:hypothetical protein